MDMDIADTVSSPAGDGSNKENDPRLVAVRPDPSRRNRPRQPIASVGYQLDPRIRRTKKDLDFTIYEDETAHEIPQPRHEYYGSNLPALPEITNGQKYDYAIPHILSRAYKGLMNEALEAGADDLMALLITKEMDFNSVSLTERVTGFYQWDIGRNPLDVWLWVQDKGYHRRWNEDQRKSFREFLGWMVPLVQAAGDNHGEPILKAIDEANTQAIMERFEELGIWNLTIEKAGLSVFFTPFGEDRHLVYKRDFTARDQGVIDAQWPEHWGPRQGSELDEMVQTTESGEAA